MLSGEFRSEILYQGSEPAVIRSRFIRNVRADFACGVHDYDTEVDDLSRDGQAKNIARLHKVVVRLAEMIYIWS
jgi:hypothetical protein